MKSLPLTALVAALALAGCDKAPETTDNAMVDVGNATDLDNVAADEAPLIEDVGAATTAAVAVPAVPKPAAGTSVADAAPLNDAAGIEEEIRAGTGIQRVRYGEGWAWTRGGRTIRTADRDGRNVAYFRGGEDKPFFVQRGERSYAYRGDKPVREFDRDGRNQAPNADRAREATEAAREAREQHERADRARESANRPDRNRPGGDRSDGDRPGGDRPGRDHPQATPTPTPAPSPSPTARGPGGRDHGDRPGWNRPSPSPSESGRPQRDRHS